MIQNNYNSPIDSAIKTINEMWAKLKAEIIVEKTETYFKWKINDEKESNMKKHPYNGEELSDTDSDRTVFFDDRRVNYFTQQSLLPSSASSASPSVFGRASPVLIVDSDDETNARNEQRQRFEER